MKKILMVVTFLFMVAMVPAAHATLYTLKAYDIWIKTDIVLNGGSITFSNAQTYATLGNLISPTPGEYNSTFDRPDGVSNYGWTSDRNGGYYRDQWSWGVEYYRKTQAIPYTWSGADGSDQYWESNGLLSGKIPEDVSIGLQKDEWLKSVLHGTLIGYIGFADPRDYAGGRTVNGIETLAGGNLTWLASANIFGIGTATVTQFGTGSVWLGFNDGFDYWNWAFPDNSGYVTVNIPEPASMLLLFFGLMGVLGLRRKFHK